MHVERCAVPIHAPKHAIAFGRPVKYLDGPTNAGKRVAHFGTERLFRFERICKISKLPRSRVARFFPTQEGGKERRVEG